MYTHAHLRWAEALAHLGDAEAFLLALRQANPVGLRDAVPSARLRQANCYTSSSDADLPGSLPGDRALRRRADGRGRCRRRLAGVLERRGDRRCAWCASACSGLRLRQLGARHRSGAAARARRTPRGARRWKDGRSRSPGASARAATGRGAAAERRAAAVHARAEPVPRGRRAASRWTSAARGRLRRSDGQPLRIELG